MAKKIAINFFEGEDLKDVTSLPQGSTCADLRQKWVEAGGDSGSDVIFTVDDVEGPVVPREGVIDELLVSRRLLLCIYVHRTEEKFVRVFGASSLEQLKIKLQPLETIKDLKNRIQTLLGIQEGRVARLLRDGRPVDEEGRACASYAGCPLVELDLQCMFAVLFAEAAEFHPLLETEFGWRVVNEDLSEKEQIESANPGQDPSAFPAFARSVERRELHLFASDPCRALAADRDEGGAGEYRATDTSSAVCISDGQPLCCLVSESSLLEGTPVGVLLERRMTLRIVDKLRQRQRVEKVWPSTRLGAFAESIDECVLLEGQLMDPRQTVWEAGAQENSPIIITRLAALSIFDETGAFRLVIADLAEALLDLRQRLNFMASDQVEIWHNGEVLRSDERSLLEHGINSTSILYALCKTRAVVLKAVGAKTVRIDSVRESTTFSAFLETASAALKTTLHPKTRFICDCGRVFSDESAERRDFPLHCCRSPEARFSVETPRRNQSSQTVWRKKKVSCQTVNTVVDASCQTVNTVVDASCQMKVRTRRRSSQTEVKTQHLVCQTGSEAGRMTCQTGTRTQHLTTQAEEERIAHLYVYWHVDNSGCFNLDLPVRGALLGREVLAAVAEVRGKRIEEMELKQDRGRRRSDGATALLVTKGNSNSNRLADESGREVAYGELENWKGHIISDQDQVLTAGHLRTYINVYKK